MTHHMHGITEREEAAFTLDANGPVSAALELLAEQGFAGLARAQNVPEGLTVFSVPVGHRRRLRTNNCPERLNRELKRRTRVASVFPNEASLLRLATALLMETDDEWQTEKRYLPKTAD